ncbi:putative ribonuclease H-like domain-containing protein [Tanacetum coccineum]
MKRGYAWDFVPLMPAMLAGAVVDQGNTSGSAEDSMQLKELMDIVPKLVTRIETLEIELQQTKTTYGKVVLTLVKRVKIMEKALKRKIRKVVISESEGEEPEDQGRIIQDIDDDPLVSLVRESMKMKEKSTNFVTPTKASGEAQEEDISPTILEAANTLRRARSVAKNINTGLDAKEEINTGIEEVNTGSTKVLMNLEAGLEKAIKLQAQIDEEVAKQIHLDEMEDWDACAIRAKLEANAQEFDKRSMCWERHCLTRLCKKNVTVENLHVKLSEESRNLEAFSVKRRLSFKEIKEEFDKYGEELQIKTLKKQKIDDKDVPAIGEKVVENAQGDSETDKEESVEAMDPTHLDTKSNIVDNVDAVPIQQYILLPLLYDSPQSSNDVVADDAGKKTNKEPANEGARNGQEKEGGPSNKEDDRNVQDFRVALDNLLVQQKEGYANSTNRDSTVSQFVSAAGGAYDDEDVNAEADLNNLETTMNVSPIPTIRIHKDHPKDQIIGDINSATQTRRMTKISEELAMESMPLEQNGSINKKDERGIVVRNKTRLVAQGYTQEVGIDYDEVFAPVARIEAIRLFLAYASFMGFIMYQMDVKSAFLYGTIEEEVYVYQPPGFEDPQFPGKVYKVEKALYSLHQALRAWYEALSTYLLENRFRRGTIDKTLFIKKDKGDIMLVQVYVDDIIFGSTKKSLCVEFEQMMHKKFQMSSMGELTFFLELQVMQKDDGIFISQDKYVADILKKFDFSSVKTASTPIETNKALLKDKEVEDVDVHLYRSMIGSLMYLTASRPDIMFVVCACVRFQVTPKTSHLHVVKRIFRYLKGQPKLGLWYPRYSPFDLEAFLIVIMLELALTGNPQQEVVNFVEKGFGAARQKTEENVEFHQIVDFLTTSSIHYALTISLTEPFNDTYETPKHTKKVFTNMKRKGKDFSGRVTPLFASMLAPPVVGGEGSGQPSEPQPPSSTTQPIIEEQIPVTELSSPQNTQSPRQALQKDTQLPQTSVPIPNVADEAVFKERDDRVVRATTTAASLDAAQASGNITKTQSTAMSNDPLSQEISSGVNTPESHEERNEQQDLTDFIPPTPHDSRRSRGHTPGSNEGRPIINELMAICAYLSNRVLALEELKIAQDLIGTSKRKGLDKENVSKQGRKSDKIKLMFKNSDFDVLDDAMEKVEGGSTVEQITTAGDTLNTASINVSTAGLSNGSVVGPSTSTTGDILEDEMTTIADTLVAIRSAR